MKKLVSILFVSGCLFYQAHAQDLRMPAPSPSSEIKQEFALSSVEVSYSRPSMKGRTILGIFLVAFYLKKIRGNAVFIAAIISEAIVIGVYFMDIISFLWLNVIGALSVILIGSLIQLFSKTEPVPLLQPVEESV